MLKLRRKKFLVGKIENGRIKRNRLVLCQVLRKELGEAHTVLLKQRDLRLLKSIIQQALLTLYVALEHDNFLNYAFTLTK